MHCRQGQDAGLAGGDPAALQELESVVSARRDAGLQQSREQVPARAAGLALAAAGTAGPDALG